MFKCNQDAAAPTHIEHSATMPNGKRVLRPLRRVGRLVGGRSRGAPVSDVNQHGSYGSIRHSNRDLQSDGTAVDDDGSINISPRRQQRVNEHTFSMTSNEQTTSRVVTSVEKALRHFLVLLVAYVVGVRHPEFMSLARRLLEWFGIAWITCLVILILSYIQQPSSTDAHEQDETTLPLLQEQEGLAVVQDVEAPQVVVVEEKHISKQEHSSLEKFYVIDRFTDTRIIPNSSKLHTLENPLFTGTMLAMIRTPNVDDPTLPSGTACNETVSSYFRDKQRRFEFQFQVSLKKRPDGAIYFACEVDDSIKLGMVQRAFVYSAMAFCKKMNNSFHYSLSGGKEEEDGKYEKVHIGFPVEMGFDRLVVTKPGEPIPKLGEAIYEDPELVKLRKKGIHKIDWNTEDTYTFAVWSAYVDFLDWSSLNLPGLRPFSLAGITGPQHITLTLFCISPDLDKHYRADMDILAEIELSNTEHTLLGPGAKRWAAKQNNLILESSDAALEQEEDLVIPRAPSYDTEENEDEDEEAQTVSELGEGMYLRSGDSVILQEGFPGGSEDVSFAGCLSNGGGFAVLQERGSSTIVIEKVRRGIQDRRTPRLLIKSGDKIMIKLITKGRDGDEKDVKYLSIHRGWWLKFVSTQPTKNGFFTIHTHETEFNDRFASSETQTTYLTLGGTFWLRHSRWSKYEVGVSAKQSPTYGGRMLGLYIPGSSNQREEIANPDDEDDAQLMELDESEGKRQNSWMRPLLFTAQKVSPALDTTLMSKELLPSLSPANSFQMSFSDRDVPISLSAGNFRIDVPGWIETVDRTDRRRQLLYIVRVSLHQEKETEAEPFVAEASVEVQVSRKAILSVVRFRNGNEIAELIRLGRALKRNSPLRSRKQDWSPDVATPPRRTEEAEVVSTVNRNEDRLDIPKSPSLGALDLEGVPKETHGLSRGHHSFDEDLLSEESDSEADLESGSSDSEDDRCDSGADDTFGAPMDITPSGSRKRNKFIGSIARSVKTGTSKTGKQVVKGSKKVGLGTVRTGKAIIAPISRAPVHSKKPPVKEPKSAKRKAKRRREGRDHYVVVNRTLKRWSSLKSFATPPSFLAGQLAAADQSCRTASHILSGMCDEPETSDFSKRFMDTLAAQISKKSIFDQWFLEGGAIEMGVASTMDNRNLLYGCPVARWLWDSHCREEWCGVYTSGVYCYAPLTREPSVVLSFVDIQAIRRLDTDDQSTLPGFSLLAIDTASRCHYFSLPSDDAREELVQALSSAMISSPNEMESGMAKGKDLWKARFWQGFQNSAESSLSGGKGKWAPVSCSSKMRQRAILNGRRMAFDIEPIEAEDNGEYLRQTSDLVADLLSMSLSFSFESLEKDPDAFVKFHDATSRLRTISLQRLDLTGSEAVCIFVNIYHCLLQHALLLTLNGPLYKRSANQFMRTTCYEIGGDVFSLAELNHCVIRGNLSRAVSPKPPYIDAPRKSNAYRFYALERVDSRINFVLNTGDASCPQAVPVLTPESLQEQLDDFSSLFVRKQLTVDTSKRIIILPRVCSVFRNDFGNGDDTVTVMFCLTFLNSPERESVIRLLKNEAQVPIYMKFQPLSETYHSRLKLWRFE